MTDSIQTPTIFLSYSWNNKNEAKILEDDFKQIGIPLIRDTLNLQYKDSLTEYMKSIRKADFAILLVSDDYLKSENCMFEVLEILKEQNHKEKILPVLLNDVKFFKTSDRIKYVKYWKQVKESLAENLQGLDVTNLLDSYQDLRKIEEIYSSMDNYLKMIGDLKCSTLEELKKENYKSIIIHLGFEDVTFVLDLIFISKISDPLIKEEMIEIHLDKFGKSYLALFSKGLIKEQLGKKEQAEQSYLQSLQLNPTNASTLNNLGFLYQTQFKNIKKAIENYKKAIKASSELIIARVNLALCYKAENKIEASRKEYLKILKFAPHDVDTHNNLGNIYRQLKNKEKAIHHLEKAIEYNPNHGNAYLNLGNYYDVELNEFEKAVPYYEKAKSIAQNESVDLLVDLMYQMREKRNKKEHK